ncbi:MAG: LacI family DNA-binding transcriptional regulator [Nocardioidaceae bacterium]
MGRVTLQTIADEVGVSRMTVSNAFSRPDQLSESLRTRILLTAGELGYAGPDPAARALARGTTGAVGVLLTSSLRYAFDDDVATGFLGAVAGEVAPTGLALTLLPAATVADVVPARDVALDGALVFSCDPDLSAVEWLTRRGLPMVFADQDPAPGVSCVNVDDRGGARAAAQHLVDLGHRDVAVLTAASGGATGIVEDPHADAARSKFVSRERLLGYLDALGAAGITAVVHRQEHNDHDEAHAAALGLLGRRDRPTGVLCFSDVIAHGVVRAAEHLGLDVPGDLSVVGFDDSPLARRLRPQLTTVHQDVREKGRLAAAALKDAMAHHRAGTQHHAEHVVLPTELVVRDSTAPAPRTRRSLSGGAR